MKQRKIAFFLLLLLLAMVVVLSAGAVRQVFALPFSVDVNGQVFVERRYIDPETAFFYDDRAEDMLIPDPQQQASISNTLYAAILLTDSYASGTASFGSLSGNGYIRTEDVLIPWPSSGSSILNLSANDTLTVVSPSLPIGTPVSLRYTLELSSATGYGFGQWDGPEYILPQAIAIATVSTTVSGLSIVDDLFGSPPPSRMVSEIVNTTVGAELAVSHQLNIDIWLYLDPDHHNDNLWLYANTRKPYAHEIADNTSVFNIDPVGSGFSILSASGHDYSSSGVEAVPEPSTFFLLIGAGLTGFGLLRKRFMQVQQRLPIRRLLSGEKGLP